MNFKKSHSHWVQLFMACVFCFHGAQSSNIDGVEAVVLLVAQNNDVTNLTATATTEDPTTCSSGYPKSCAEIQRNSGLTSSSICKIYPFGPEEKSVQVFCDFETDGGAWTTFQKRSSGPKEEFYRGWEDYEVGFGSVDGGNYWVGLKAIHALSEEQDQELRIDLWDFEGGYAYAEYSNFSVSDSSDFYRLSIDGYSGTAGDSMTFHNLNGMRFTTKDQDNDNYAYNCAEDLRGAWWYKGCTYSNLNGLYYQKGETPYPDRTGICWYHWKSSWRSLQQAEMKIRPRS